MVYSYLHSTCTLAYNIVYTKLLKNGPLAIPLNNCIKDKSIKCGKMNYLLFHCS